MLRIRDLAAADLHRVARLEQGEPSAWDSGDIGREIEQRHGIQLVVVDEADGDIVGWCCSRFVEAEAELLKITVLGSCRRRGIASTLLADLQDRLVARGVRTLFLEVRSHNDPALRLYRRHGFAEVGRRRRYYSSPEDDALILAKELAGECALSFSEKENSMKSIHDLQLNGRRVLLRADFNVPMNERGEITDDIRIRSVLPTIEYIIAHQGKLIICSHMGRPKGKPVAEFSLAPVAAHLQSLIGRSVRLAPDCIGDGVREVVAAMAPGDVVMLENLRFHNAETGNDPEFSAQLAGLADVYINDAFAVSHRAHASVVGVAERVADKAAGLLLQAEIDYYHKAMDTPIRPLVALVGGAKVSSKLAALENMLTKVDRMIIGGAMANTFLKSQGVDVGASKVEEDLLEAAGRLVATAREKGVKIFLPVDFVVADAFSAEATVKNVTIQDVPPTWMALDIGPASTILFKEALQDAKTIVWNGPMGAFEIDAFARGTMALCQAVASSHALSITGGGDSNAAVKKAGEERNITYMSTGGGAFLELMEGKSLPGIDALS